jgi:hypothetical protein
MTSAMSAPYTVINGTNRVELSLAADAQMLFLARMTGAAVASRAQFEYDQVEDLRLAIDELCVRLISSASDTGTGRISLLFQWSDDGDMEVTGTLIPEGSVTGNGHHPIPSTTLPTYELSERILDALVDEHGSDSIEGAHRAWLRMKRQEHLA